ncbi:MAG: hypothetical protein WBP81_04810 [Solirubrobacteraceae bacterium]
MEEIVSLAGTQARTAILLEAVDAAGTIPSHEIRLLDELAAQTRWPVVATSHAEADSEWSQLSRGGSIPLGGFGAEDLTRCLRSAPECADRTVDEIDERVSLIVANRAGPVRPTEAYALLEDWI